MPERKPRLSDFSRNVYSQFGEDGILAKIFEIIEPRSKTCVEFGAWEGYLHSNTANLWTNGWKGILIEGDKEKFDKLFTNTREYDCACIHAFVRPSGVDSIDTILERQGIQAVDLMSIDIDGNDYYIFESITKIMPRIVICEFNPTIPKHLEIVAAPDNFFGCSSLALVNLARRKGYELIAMTDTNCIFVHREEFPAFSAFETEHEFIAPENNLTWLITGYNGSYALSRDPAYGFNKPYAGKLAIGQLRHVKFDGFLIKILKKAYYSRTAASLKMAWMVARWYMSGKKTPPPQYVKARTLATLGKRYGLRTFIETGTYLGQTVNSLKNKFKEIHSIEISEKLFNRANKVFQKFNHVHIHQGDSATVLPRVLAELKEPALFWLDGHYSGGLTEKGALETPINQELESIFAHPIKSHVILIDDARCFVGKDDYPTLDELKSHVARLKPDAKIQVRNDMILIADKILN